MTNLPRSPWTHRWLLLALCITAIAVVAISFAARKEELLQVHAVSPAYRDLTASLSTNGRVTPISAFQARAGLATTVEKIYVKVGEKVKPGQLLVKLKDPFSAPRYTSAVAGLEGAEAANESFRKGGSQEDRINLAADLDRAKAEQADAAAKLATLQQLQQRSDASQAEVGDAQRRLDAANLWVQSAGQKITDRYSAKDLAGAAARLADARANVVTAKEVLANENITSTIAGTVYGIPVSPYDFVNVGADLVLVANLDAVQIRAYFDEPDIGQLRAGQPVEVFWDARPGVSWHGRVEQPPLTVFPMGARTVGECIITVDNSNGALLPNTNVTVRVQTGHHAHVLAIPREALHTDGAAHFVFRVVDGRLVRTPVTIGLVNLSFAEITGGLSPTDTVAIDALNGTQLSNDQHVRPQP